MTMKQWNQRFPDHKIRPEDLPARADQHDQAAAARYAAMDYLERYFPLIDQLPKANAKAERLRRFRIQQIGKDLGPDATWLEWFRKSGLSRPISDAEYQEAEARQRGGSLASRIKYIEHQFKVEEPARIRSLLGL